MLVEHTVCKLGADPVKNVCRWCKTIDLKSVIIWRNREDFQFSNPLTCLCILNNGCVTWLQLI